MNPIRLFTQLRLFLAIFIVSWLCQSCFLLEREEKRRAAERIRADTLGRMLNADRQKLGIPILPDSVWVFNNTSYNTSSKVGNTWFDNRKSGVDSLPRHAIKRVWFFEEGLRPVRETDIYYSGRRFVGQDPDSQEWERVELTYSYISDTLQLNSNIPDRLRQGWSCQLFAPQPVLFKTSERPSGIYWLLLIPVPISLTQADSVLKSWGLSRSKEGEGIRFWEKDKRIGIIRK